MPRRKRGATDREHVVLVCPCCDRLLWPRTYTDLMRRPRRNVFALLMRGKKGGGWKTQRSMVPDELPDLFAYWKRRLLFTVQAWRGLGWLTDADFAFVGTVSNIRRDDLHITTERQTWNPERVAGAIPLRQGPPTPPRMQAAEPPAKAVKTTRSVLRL